MDLRVKKTERAIREAFFQLVQKKPVNKITVKELSELAEINKTTFYAHYDTIYDLLETLEQELLETIVEHLDEFQILFDDPKTFVYDLYETFCQVHADELQLRSSNWDFSAKLTETLIKRVAENGFDYRDYSQIGFLLQFLISGLLGVQKSSQSNASKEELEYLATFVEGGIRSLPTV